MEQLRNKLKEAAICFNRASSTEDQYNWAIEIMLLQKQIERMQAKQ